MPDNKLTDEEIIRIMEICVNKTDVFVIHHNAETREYDQITIKDILGVINRQKGENERLKSKLEPQGFEEADPMDFCGVLCDFAEGLIKKAKTEAYKECIEKVKAIAIKKKIVYVADASLQEQKIGWLEIQEEKLDTLLKELVGDNNGNTK